MYDNNKSKLLHRMLPKTMAYVKSYDELTNWVYFLLEDYDLLEKYNTVQDIKKEFCSKPVYNKIFL